MSHGLDPEEAPQRQAAANRAQQGSADDHQQHQPEHRHGLGADRQEGQTAGEALDEEAVDHHHHYRSQRRTRPHS